MNNKVTILDYGFGNVFSLANALKFLNVNVDISNDPSHLIKSDRIIITGVCAFNACIDKMNEKGLDEFLIKYAELGRPILGICIGMQILFDSSNEFSECKGLSLIKGNIKEIPNKTKEGKNLKVPHMGWSELLPANSMDNWNDGIMKSIKPSMSAYFAHSYSAQNMNSKNIVAETSYGGNKLSAVVQNDNIFGCQFHPEKSHNLGLKILENYLNI